MPDLTILGRKIYFDRQHVADLAPSLVEGTTLHGEFLALLRAGARDRAKCAESARTEREFIADIYEAVAALRESLENCENGRDQQLACAAILQACRHQMAGRLHVVAESKDDGWALRGIDAAAVHDFNDES